MQGVGVNVGSHVVVHCPHMTASTCQPARRVPSLSGTLFAFKRHVRERHSSFNKVRSAVRDTLNAELFDFRVPPAAAPTAPTEQLHQDKDICMPEHCHDSSWEQWCSHFNTLDNNAEELKILETQLKRAVISERYSQAAALKQQITQLQNDNVVLQVQQQLQRALSDERYDEAARVRDEALVALQGWWSGRSEDDPYGHLLHVTAEYGRWTGRVYTSRDLTDATRSWAEPKPDNVEQGSPIMEIFLKRLPDGRVVHKAVSLIKPHSSTQDLSPLPAVPAEYLRPKPNIDTTDLSAIVLNVSVDERGTAMCKMQPKAAMEAGEQALLPNVNTDASSFTALTSEFIQNMSPSDYAKIDSMAAGMPLKTPLSYMEGVGLVSGNSQQQDTDMVELQRTPADIKFNDRTSFTFEVDEATNTTPSNDSQDVRVSWVATDSWGKCFCIQLPARAGNTSASAVADSMQAALSRVSEEIASLQEARGKKTISRALLAESLRGMVLKCLQSGASAEHTEYLKASDLEPSQPSTRFTYTKLNLDYVRTDPFSGLFLATFGQHGPELVQVSRGVWDGEECVTAVKVTGDINVPAGAVSFRAKIGPRRKLDPRDIFMPELGVVARYKGQGVVAQAGFKGVKWVDGEVLVFATGAKVTGNAELGFMWCFPNGKRLLILLNRIDLQDLLRGKQGL